MNVRHRADLTKRFGARAVEVFAASTTASPGLHFKAATATEPAEMLIYDAIGDDGWGGGVSAASVLAALKSAGASHVLARINSPGGDVFDGYAIYNALKAHPGGVTTQVDGVAASAASLIALAGSKVTMADTSMLMIHNSNTFAYGDKQALSKTIEVLGKIDGQLNAVYAAKTGMTTADVQAMMDAETWLTGSEAKAAGFATEVLPPPGKAPKAAAFVKIRAAAESIDPETGGTADGDAPPDTEGAADYVRQAIDTANDMDADTDELTELLQSAHTALTGANYDSPVVDPDEVAETVTSAADLGPQIEARRRLLRIADEG